MNKRLVIDFLSDHISATAAFFASIFSIILFYVLSFPEQRLDWVYPLLIAFFIYLLFTIYRFYQYYVFNKKYLESQDFEGLPVNRREYLKIVRAMKNMQESHLHLLDEERFQNRKYKRFISQWVHNMKTPVTVIDLALQRYKAGDMALDKILNNVGEENQRLLHQLEQLIDMLRLEEFSRDYTPEAHNLEASVKKLINEHKNQFIYSNVFPVFTLRSCEPDRQPVVLTDPKWNEAMINQIINNAIKYSKSEGKTKSIYFTIICQEKNVVLKIKDEGIGIPGYDLKRIFEPFFTGRNGRQTDGASGIGLYFCSEVAHKLGHKLEIKSEEGKGTEVEISYLAKM